MTRRDDGVRAARHDDAIDESPRPDPAALPVIDLVTFRRAQRGDQEAFAEIVRALQRPALRLATVVAGDPTEAHDIVQDAFVRAFGALASLRSHDALRPWVMRAVANQAKNARRGRQRRERRHLRVAGARVAEPETTEQAALSGLMGEQVMRALRLLPGRDRQVLACRYLAELNERETAEVLGVPAGTVKSRTARALERLRAAYGETGDDDGAAD